MGLVDYNTLREAYGLPRVSSWDDVTNDTQTKEQLKLLYPDINDVDAYVGMFNLSYKSRVVHGYLIFPAIGAICEEPTGRAVVGPLSKAIIKEQFLRMRAGDRFWYENPGVLTPSELEEIKSFTYGYMVTNNTNIDVFPENPFIVAVPDYKLGAKLSLGDTSEGSYVVVMGMIKLSWKVNGDRMDFVVESDAGGWFGFGFGSNMLPADIILCHHDTTDGEWICEDKYR